MKRIGFVAVLLLSVAGCGGGTSSSGTPATPSPTPTASSPTLFVAEGGGPPNTVTAYLPPYSGEPELSLTPGTLPDGLAFDANGDLFVANHYGSAVEYLAPLTGGPTALPVSNAQALGFDPSGNLFLVTFNEVAELAEPYTSVSASFSVAGYQSFVLGINSRGDVFINSGQHSVYEYVPPFTQYSQNSTPAATISSGVNGFSGRSNQDLAFDASDDLFVANSVGNTVTEYAPPYTQYGTNGSTPEATITAGISAPQAIAFDSNGNLFVANNNNTVTEYAPPFTQYGSGAVPAATISSGLNGPITLEIDKRGDLFVGNCAGNTVTMYTPPYTGVPQTTSNGVQCPTVLLLK